MVWFCGGHGDCETPADDNAAIRAATMAWLDRWVMRRTTVDTGPKFEWIDQNGQYYSSNVLPTDKTVPRALRRRDGRRRCAADHPADRRFRGRPPVAFPFLDR